MLSKQQVSFIRSLHQKKFRQMYGKFLVEGDKLVRELLTSDFKVDAIYGIDAWQNAVDLKKVPFYAVSEAELAKISTHEAPNQVLAIADIPTPANGLKLDDTLYVACDSLNDPGNAGTIIRTADWFGIKHVLFSENSVEVYNPKVVSSAKGSLFRVACTYTDLATLFTANPHLPVYGTFMDGSDIYKAPLTKTGIILIGNEANGITAELQPLVKHRISIPNFGKAESLNAAMAAGIVMSEFRRR